MKDSYANFITKEQGNGTGLDQSVMGMLNDY